MLIKYVCQTNVIFFTIGILSMNHNIVFKYEPYLCNDCHDLMQKDMSFNNVAIFHVKGSAYRIHFWHMSQECAINTRNDSNLVDKRSVL